MKKNKNYPWPYWMGIRGFYFVWHGEWSDAEIVWHGYAMNIHAVEDPMWADYCEHCNENGLEQTEDGFVDFCKKETWRMRDYAHNAIDCGYATRIRKGVFHYYIPLTEPSMRTYPVYA